MRVLILTMFAHLSPGRAPKSLAWALGDTLDDSPSEDPVVGAVVLDQRVVVDGVDIITAPTAAEPIIRWTVARFVFSLKYGRGASTAASSRLMCLTQRTVV